MSGTVLLVFGRPLRDEAQGRQGVTVDLRTITRTLVQDTESLTFRTPVSYHYNPLDYAREPHEKYLRRYGQGKKQVLLVGMNPGPWGMAQTGIPFGAIGLVKEWLGIEARVRQPGNMHPKRPVTGFSCTRNEVSGQRLWGWARDRFGTPEQFLSRFFVVNYCPLIFFDRDHRNITPDKLPSRDREGLFRPCDQALAETAKLLQPEFVLGVGNFAAGRVQAACHDLGVFTGKILHPSPANPHANRGWAPLVEAQMQQLGIDLPA
jgi:single-strand selective monofunctional uracil DNA glycosylase